MKQCEAPAPCASAKLKMRDCIVSNNTHGIEIFDYATADLGTAESAGNNLIQSNFHGLEIEALADHGSVDAAGNTWRASVQGSDGSGRYSPQTIQGPFGSSASGGNFVILAGWSVRL